MGAATVQSYGRAVHQLDAIASESAAESVLAAARALQHVPQLASTLSDALIEKSVKAPLVDQVFGPTLDAEAVKFLEQIVVLPWSSAREFTSSLESLGVLALSHDDPTGIAAELLDTADLFDRHWDLTKAVGDRLADADKRKVLLRNVLASSIGPTSLQIIEHVALTRGAGQLAPTLRTLAKLILAHDGKQLAIIRSAISLGRSELDQLLAPLERSFDTALVAHTQIDPGLIGGAKVTVGSRVIDGSLQTRLRDLKQALAT